MGIAELMIIAIGVSMDAFAVSVCKGLSVQNLRPRHVLQTGLWFGGFQALMPLLGYYVGSHFASIVENFDHWIAFGILTFLGGQMIVESFKEEEDKHNFDPTCIKVILGLAMATSIDALVIGATFAFLGYNHISTIISPIGIIGLVSFIMSIIGLLIGIGFGNGIARKLRAERLGGIVLVAIGIKILIEHLFFQ